MPYPLNTVYPSGGIWPGIDGDTPPPEPALPPFSVEWDKDTERYVLYGVDRGVLYVPGQDPVPWNGITGLDESSDATRSVLYRDGRIYLADVDPGDFEGSLNAFSYPDAFSECVGIPEVATGLFVDNQKPKQFGMSYRTLIGSGLTGDRFGYQIHLLYNAVATIGTRTRKTMTETAHLTELSFDITATPVKLPGMRPSAHYIIDTRNLSEDTVRQLEVILYGEDGASGSLPEPLVLFDLLKFGSSITFTDHGDGTWTASGSSSNIIMTGPGTWQILNVNGVDNGDGTYLLQDTP